MNPKEKAIAALELAKHKLVEALGGERYDASWMRPMRLPMVERQRLYNEVVLYIDAAMAQVAVLT